jgi:hypothetical protein
LYNFNFLISDEYSQYFKVTNDGNKVILQVANPLPVEALSQRKLFLVVRANREFTTGTSATVIVQLPEGRNFPSSQKLN